LFFTGIGAVQVALVDAISELMHIPPDAGMTKEVLSSIKRFLTIVLEPELERSVR
jgi:hypothetical protein